MHTYTDGIGYGLSRMGPASARYPTPRDAPRGARWDKLWRHDDAAHNPAAEKEKVRERASESESERARASGETRFRALSRSREEGERARGR